MRQIPYNLSPRPLFSSWRGYALTLILVGLVTLLGLEVKAFFDVTNILMGYLLIVVVTAILAGTAPSIVASLLSVAMMDYVFIPPFMSFGPPRSEHIFTLMVFLVVGILVSSLTSRIRSQIEATRRREHQTALLYGVSRTLANSVGLDETMRAIVGSAKKILGTEVIIFLPDSKKADDLQVYQEIEGVTIRKEEIEGASDFLKGEPIAAVTSRRYFRLVSAGKTVGAMAVPASSRFTSDQERLMEAFADLASVSIERTRLAEKAQEAEIAKATERLQTILLNSISHDLRTPLVSVIGVLSSLQEERMDLNTDARTNLIQVAREEAERLNRLVTNLLDMSRLEAGVIRISKQPSEVQDLIGAALEQLARESSRHPVEIHLPDDLPFVSVDFGLMVQTLVNILDNAFKYSPAGSPVNISARLVGPDVQIEISDRGIGMAQQDLVRVFHKFYRVRNGEGAAGTGLGLSICKGIVEAHGGQIVAESHPGGGTTIRLMLPTGQA